MKEFVLFLGVEGLCTEEKTSCFAATNVEMHQGGKKTNFELGRTRTFRADQQDNYA